MKRLHEDICVHGHYLEFQKERGLWHCPVCKVDYLPDIDTEPITPYPEFDEDVDQTRRLITRGMIEDD